MLLPGGAAFPRVAAAIPSQTLEFGAVLAGPIELRPLPKRSIPLGAILARTRKTRTFIAAAILPRFVEARLVEIPRTLPGGT
jgi:hypothetical protein